MTRQFSFFAAERDASETRPKVLEGFRYQPELISAVEEEALLKHVRELPVREFEFHGYTGKRRVIYFGWQYDFTGSRLRKADEIPDFLQPLRARAAAFANLESEVLQQVLVTEYGPGTGIGWHRDKAVFGEVVGISLLAPCVLRFRRKINGGVDSENVKADAMQVKGKTKGAKVRAKWDRINVLAEPRSAYHLSGPARLQWQHSILRVESLRYSITFRSVREY